jgi:1-acyl-sn-glycerol-3-phosphate acyltransferase
MALILQDRVAPLGPEPRRGAIPVLKTALYTLDISARFLAAAAVGRGSVAVADRLLDGYWRRIFQSGNCRLIVEGREHFDGRASVVMSNHTSLLDIPALMGAVPGSLRMVLKQELTHVPIWGPALVESGFVPVQRGAKEKAIEQLSKAEGLLAKGVHIWISPEGTRSRHGELQPFKKGGFHLARSLGAPIVPAWIEGAAIIVPPDQFTAAYDGTVTVRFGKPIETAGADIDALMTEVRRAMVGLSGRAGEGASAEP